MLCTLSQALAVASVLDFYHFTRGAVVSMFHFLKHLSFDSHADGLSF